MTDVITPTVYSMDPQVHRHPLRLYGSPSSLPCTRHRHSATTSGNLSQLSQTLHLCRNWRRCMLLPPPSVLRLHCRTVSVPRYPPTLCDLSHIPPGHGGNGRPPSPAPTRINARHGTVRMLPSLSPVAPLHIWSPTARSRTVVRTSSRCSNISQPRMARSRASARL